MTDPATKQEWLHSLRAKQQRATLVPYWVLSVLILAIGLALVAGKVYAEPMAQASAGGVVITVYTEACTHPDHVTNLPKRATWKEGDKVYDGCAGAIPELGVAMFWFTDRTMAVVPLQMFAKVTGV